MDKQNLDYLKSLHTGEIDARNGYEEALVDADSSSLKPLFREMLDLHESNAEELSAFLVDVDEPESDEGSFMSVIHRTIMNVRALFNGLDDSVLPGLIDGEKRNVESYDQALATGGFPAQIEKLLADQRDKIQQKIAYMQQQRETALQE